MSATELFRPASSVLQAVRGAIDAGEAPELWPAGPGELGRFELGPGLVTLLGGAPGSGKTAFALQATVDILRTQTAERALVANVEMSAEALLERQLSRLSGVALDRIRRRALEPGDLDPFERAVDTLEELGDRLGFMVGPFTTKRLADAAEALGARLLVVDYVQRFRASDVAREPRQAVTEVMDDLRKLTNAGAAVLVLSALARTRGSRGSSYDGADPLAGFRDSSELEFGADEAYVLERATEETGSLAILKHGKCRHGELRDLVLRFDGARQAFEVPMLPELARATVGAP